MPPDMQKDRLRKYNEIDVRSKKQIINNAAATCGIVSINYILKFKIA